MGVTQMEKSTPEFESDLQSALNALKGQGLNIESAFVGADGFVFPVSGYLLTTAQILMLRRTGKLDLQGIIEFDANERETVERDILSARKRVRPEELKTWSALDLCAYINKEFNRNHSEGQTSGVLRRLGIEHRIN
jgi:hypothetical protein